MKVSKGNSHWDFEEMKEEFDQKDKYTPRRIVVEDELILLVIPWFISVYLQPGKEWKLNGFL